MKHKVARDEWSQRLYEKAEKDPTDQPGKRLGQDKGEDHPGQGHAYGKSRKCQDSEHPSNQKSNASHGSSHSNHSNQGNNSNNHSSNNSSNKKNNGKNSTTNTSSSNSNQDASAANEKMKGKDHALEQGNGQKLGLQKHEERETGTNRP